VGSATRRKGSKAEDTISSNMKLGRLAMAIMIPGRVDDGGWSESAARAGESLARSAAMQVEVVAELGENGAAETVASIADRGTDLIIGHGFEFITTFLRLAPNYPQSNFFAMDKVKDEDGWPDNFGCLYQRQDEAIYLCGRLSAHMTQNARVGFIGGVEIPTQLSNGRAFERGAKSLQPSIDVLTSYAGTFEDPEKGHKIAKDMIDQGADLIMHTASETGNGVIAACKEGNVYTFGFILDLSDLAPNNIVTSLILDVKNIYRRKAQEVAANRFRAGVWTVGLREGLIGLAPLSDIVPMEAVNDIKKTERDIVAGIRKL